MAVSLYNYLLVRRRERFNLTQAYAKIDSSKSSPTIPSDRVSADKAWIKPKLLILVQKY